jgi:vitamin K-dependent gamma-carboxylase-like protein
VAVAELSPAESTEPRSLNPLAVRGTHLPPNVLLAAKLVTLVLLIGWRGLTDPYLPFIGFLDDLVSPGVYRHTLQAVFLLAAACLFINRFVRLSCGVLGGTILLAVLSSQAYRANNLTFTALLLILIGLSDRTTVSTIIRAQLFVLYFWAGMNKLLDENWRSGAFFETWNSLQGYGDLYRTMASQLPATVLSVVLSWVVIATELFLSVAFAVRRLVPVGILIVVVYHSSLLFVVGGTFGMFWFSLLAACLALTRWPARRPSVDYGVDGSVGRLTGLLRKLDLGRAFAWDGHEGSGLRLVVEEQAFSGRDALARVLFYHPTLYFIYFALVAVPQPQPRWAALVAFGVVGYVVFDLTRTKLRPHLQAEA